MGAVQPRVGGGATASDASGTAGYANASLRRSPAALRAAPSWLMSQQLGDWSALDSAVHSRTHPPARTTNKVVLIDRLVNINPVAGFC